MKKMIFLLIAFCGSHTFCSNQIVDNHVQEIVAHLNVVKNEIVGNFFKQAYLEHKEDLLSNDNKIKTEDFFKGYVQNNFSLSKTQIPYINTKKNNIFIMQNIVAPLFLRYSDYENEEINFTSKNAINTYITESSNEQYNAHKLYIKSFDLIFHEIISNDHEKIRQNIENHLQIIDEAEKVIFTVDERDKSNQNEIFQHYVNNKYNVNELIDFANANKKNNQSIKNIIAPLLLYEIINNIDAMDYLARRVIVRMYDPNNDINLKPNGNNTDILYKLIYKQCKYAQQIKKLKCRYNIALYNTNEELLDYKDLSVFFEDIVMHNLGNCMLLNYQNNKINQDKLINSIGIKEENIKYFLEHSKDSYPDFFARLFVQKFDLAWFLESPEQQTFWFENLQYFNSLNCTQKRIVSAEMVTGFFRNIVNIYAQNDDRVRELTKFINTNIEYKDKPIKYIDAFEDRLDKAFLEACIKVGFIDNHTKFLNVNIIGQNNPLDDDMQRAIAASLQDHNGNVQWYQNKYLLAGVSLSGLGLFVYLVLKGKFTQKKLSRTKQT